MQQIKVDLAFAFTCPHCSRRNFVEALIVEFTPEQTAEGAEDTAVPLKTGNWVTYPGQVACACGEDFETERDPQENYEQ
jgi:hypothetical protein